MYILIACMQCQSLPSRKIMNGCKEQTYQNNFFVDVCVRFLADLTEYACVLTKTLNVTKFTISY